MFAVSNFHFPSDFTPTFSHPESKELVYGRIVIPFAKFWMKYVQRLEVFIKHAERIPQDGPAMIAMNHTGYWDFVYGGIPAAFNGGRLVRYMAKKEIFDTPVAGQIMRSLKHIPVDREAGAESAREAVRRLKQGQLVGIFPEATISRSFEIKELREGAARIAYEGGVPLIPLILWGSQRVWTKGYPSVWRPKNAKIIMYVGEPVEVTADAKETTERLRTAMQELLLKARNEYVERFGPMPEGEYWVPASMGGSAPTLEEATIQDRKDAEERKKKRAERNAMLGVQQATDRAELANATGVKKLLVRVKQRLRKIRTN
ncbi:lysophospholipid acyltransferase family protein [Corynebacterium anserum]|uniref:1-acyl-sn-glycerol-3-phosphate acyltransferase n=1 Tax=Corynebacterium anserum TaxID=2684406 RepID=A0A7G7YLL8_9CORY|nr:lysophospholipid acyltransferase family protein [Corynebacterium anserum]MBC2681454.1 1-acyl-sn-glycerol-3-phosphate acyltransferase [Corynebacterium anserum]QNH95388.1 1-acyl-sn-glycerol-3-phosphate acyltransferase [Corynebacterium anserum]